ncbi:MAG: molybdenum cofactor guanylyltransferase [Bacteroidia bacterium]|nr:molybdenum cofactor guanylyltransferase [Bacteroidia bacterium]
MAIKEKITGIILAGGKSSRMGFDKGLIEINNKPMVQYIIDQLKLITDTILIISNNNEYNKFGHTVHADLIKNVGPIGGILTGLEYSQTKYNMVISCDTPFIKKNTLTELVKKIDKYDVIIASNKGEAHPLCGIYSKTIANQLRVLIENRQFKIRKAIQQFNTKVVEFETTSQFVNINTKEELNNYKHNYQ